jgi:monovalent cation:H+ antiporter-2, CPA2 family
LGEQLVALGGGLVAAGLLARAGRRVGLPTIPFFILAGIVFGPHTPGPVLVQDPDVLSLVAALGLILLLFHLGLEFSLGDLIEGGPRLLKAGGTYLVLNVGAGLVFGFTLGWGTPEALVVAGAVGISSSAIVTKLLIELRRLPNPETRLILGIIVVEDIFLALYLALLAPFLDPDATGLDAVIVFLVAFGFILLLFAVARWGARWVGKLIDTPDAELLVVLFLGLAVVVAGISEELGVSDAIGAFMVGLIIAETRAKHRVEELVLPIRDAFAALFFFWFGLTIDPAGMAEVAVPVLIAVVLALITNPLAGFITARANGLGRVAAINIGTAVLSRGEFAIILATLAAGAGLDPRITPFVGLYVLVLAIASPLLASRSRSLGRFVPVGWFPRGSPATRPYGAPDRGGDGRRHRRASDAPPSGDESPPRDPYADEGR